MWNPWHGCTKASAGCQNCYMFRRDAKYGINSTIVRKTKDFNLPVRRTRSGEYKLKPDGGVISPRKLQQYPSNEVLSVVYAELFFNNPLTTVRISYMVTETAVILGRNSFRIGAITVEILEDQVLLMLTSGS